MRDGIPNTQHLITGAGGKTGGAVIRALVARGVTVRAFAHRPEQTQAIQELGAQEVVVGDMSDRAAMEQAARGAKAIYHICSNMNPDEVAFGEVVIAAARAAGVERLVYHSVLHPQTEAMPHHWNKLRVEEKLFESGLSYTILQPAAYMQNVLAYWTQIVEQGVYPVPYSVEARLSMIDLQDVAEAAAIVLTEAGHANATYELAGPEALSQVEVAEILSQQLGRPVRAQTVPLDEWDRKARASGMSDYATETLLKMFHYYDRFGLCGNPNVLTWLLHRPATTFTTFCRANTQYLISNT
jgi:NAD(P)H dehydrogenase (quinone)